MHLLVDSFPILPRLFPLLAGWGGWPVQRGAERDDPGVGGRRRQGCRRREHAAGPHPRGVYRRGGLLPQRHALPCDGRPAHRPRRQVRHHIVIMPLLSAISHSSPAIILQLCHYYLPLWPDWSPCALSDRESLCEWTHRARASWSGVLLVVACKGWWLVVVTWTRVASMTSRLLGLWDVVPAAASV